MGLILVLLLRRTAQFRAIVARPAGPAAAHAGRRGHHASTGCTYIWGVNNGRVVETSLGYFINPLVTVLMGVLILGERLRPLQWVAMGVATLAVGRAHRRLRAAAVGRAGAGAARSAPTGCARRPRASARSRASRSRRCRDRAVRRGLPRLAGRDRGLATSPPHGVDHALLLATTGIVTAIPLICFGAAAIRVLDGDARAAAVPRAGPAVRARRPVVPRGHAARPLDRLRPGLGRAGDLHRRGGPPPAPPAALTVAASAV